MKCLNCNAKGAVATGYNKVISVSPVKTEAEYYCSSCETKFFKLSK